MADEKKEVFENIRRNLLGERDTRFKKGSCNNKVQDCLNWMRWHRSLTQAVPNSNGDTVWDGTVLVLEMGNGDGERKLGEILMHLR